MKSSRAMLLSAILFATPVVFGSETAANTEVKAEDKSETAANTEVKAEDKSETAANTEVKAEDKSETAANTAANTEVKAEDKKEDAKKVETPSWLSAKTAAATAAMAATANFVSTPADWTLRQLTRISYLKGGKFEDAIPTIAKTLTGLALVAAAIKVYQLVYADNDDVDNDDELFNCVDDNN